MSALRRNGLFIDRFKGVEMPRVALEPGYVTVPDDDADARLLASYSPAADTYFFPRRRCCPLTFTPVEDRELSPRGVLYAWSYLVVTGSDGPLRVGVCQVDLPEGPRVQAALVGDVDDWQIGMEVVLTLVPVYGREHVPMSDAGGNDIVTYGFRPAGVR